MAEPKIGISLATTLILLIPFWFLFCCCSFYFAVKAISYLEHKNSSLESFLLPIWKLLQHILHRTAKMTLKMICDHTSLRKTLQWFSCSLRIRSKSLLQRSYTHIHHTSPRTTWFLLTVNFISCLLHTFLIF